MIESIGESIISEEFDYSVFPTDASTPTPSADLVRWPAPWLGSKIREIQRLVELPSNWDSYGAHAVDQYSVLWAVARTQALARETMQEPRVGCLPNGHVMLAWESDDDTQTCEIEFLPNGLMEYMRANERDPSFDCEGTAFNLGEVLPRIPGTGM